jgi:hypothetical protein
VDALCGPGAYLPVVDQSLPTRPARRWSRQPVDAVAGA